MSILGNEFLQSSSGDTSGIQPGSSPFSLDSSLNDPAFKSLNPIMENPALSNPPTNSDGTSNSSSPKPTPFSWTDPSTWLVNQDPSTPLISGKAVSHEVQKGAIASWGRIGGFIVGLICIGAGLLMFKQTQTIITTTAKAAGKAAVAVA